MELPEAATGFLETPLGLMHYTVNEGWHVYLDSGSRAGWEGHPLTVNRVEYHTSVHITLADGVWQIKDWHDLHMYRPGTINSYPSEAAKKKAGAILLEAWTEYIKDRPELLVQGEIYAVSRRVRDAEEEISKLQEKLEEANTARENALQRLRELGYFGPHKQDWTSRF